MNNKIKQQLEILMRTIHSKKHGNLDEADVQRELGILYHLYIAKKRQTQSDPKYFDCGDCDNLRIKGSYNNLKYCCDRDIKEPFDNCSDTTRIPINTKK